MKGDADALRAAREAQFEGRLPPKILVGLPAQVLAGKVSLVSSGLTGKQATWLEFAGEVIEAVKNGADAGQVADMMAAAFASRGGKARAAKLGQDRRSEIARIAAKARHGGG